MEMVQTNGGNRMRERKTRSVSHQYFTRVSPPRVFEAITKSKWLVKWLADTAVIPPRKGGRYSIGWKDGPTHEGEVLDFVPGKSVTLAWSWEGVKLKGTTFRLSVEPKDDGYFVRGRALRLSPRREMDRPLRWRGMGMDLFRDESKVPLGNWA